MKNLRLGLNFRAVIKGNAKKCMLSSTQENSSDKLRTLHEKLSCAACQYYKTTENGYDMAEKT